MLKIQCNIIFILNVSLGDQKGTLDNPLISEHPDRKSKVSAKLYPSYGQLKRHLNKLLFLQNQEKGVEEEIASLKNQIYKKIKKERVGFNLTDTAGQEPLRDTSQSTTFGNVGNSKLELRSSAGNRVSGVTLAAQDHSLISKNDVLDGVNLNKQKIRVLHHLSKLNSKLNDTKWINWRIENHGKQTIILL